MLINDLEYFDRSANYTAKTSGIDRPNSVYVSVKEWHNYPVQNFNYEFNSWGFRGPDYDQYVGKKVNICLGDSFTVNVGGPIEHSWCSQLAEHFDIPTLNLGMDGAGNDAIRLVYGRACEIFDVQNCFVMYSYLHRRLENNNFVQGIMADDSENFDYFEENIIQDAVYTFIPSWCWNENELDYLQNKHKKNLYNLLDSESLAYTMISKKLYNTYKGSDWVSYNEFTKGLTNTVMEHDEFFRFIKEKYGHINRDGHHLNQLANQVVANFLWNQYNAA